MHFVQRTLARNEARQGEMDTDWFDERLRILGLTQEDVGPAIGKHRTTYSRMKNGLRKLLWEEVEPLAVALKVSPIEIIEHVHDWTMPIRAQTLLRDDLLLIALFCATDAQLADATLVHEIARDAAGIYRLLVESEARGVPIEGDETALRLIKDLLRITREPRRD